MVSGKKDFGDFGGKGYPNLGVVGTDGGVPVPVLSGVPVRVIDQSRRRYAGPNDRRFEWR